MGLIILSPEIERRLTEDMRVSEFKYLKCQQVENEDELALLVN